MNAKSTEMERADQAFLLPRDVLFVPTEELSADVRQALQDSDGHFAVTRPGFRVPSRLVDEDTAALLKEFQTPSTIADAVVRFCSSRQLDPQSIVEQAFPVLQLFSGSRILVPEDSADVDSITASLAPGMLIDDIEILAPLQYTHDSEVYKAKKSNGLYVALKIEATGAPPGTAAQIDREQEVLSVVSEIAPEIVASGEYRSRRYIATRWFNGVPLTTRSAEIRHSAKPGWRNRLHALACNVVEQYMRLHTTGFIHGDIHGNNVLSGESDKVVLIDFGMSRRMAAPRTNDMPLVGFSRYLDPRTASELLEGTVSNRADSDAEIYAIAALVYEVYTGSSYLDFSPELDCAYQQIVSDAPLPFVRCGFESWPEIERVLHIALAKEARNRHQSLAVFTGSLANAAPPGRNELEISFNKKARPIVDRYVPDIKQAVPALETLYTEAPTVSTDRGCIGYAWFLYRLAQLRERPDLLAIADIWCRRALAHVNKPDAFFTPPSANNAVQIDSCSIMHRAPGVYYVHALVCHARGDLSGLHACIDKLLVTAKTESDVIDVTLGRAGNLIAMTNLLAAISSSPLIDTTRLAEITKQETDFLSQKLSEEDQHGLINTQPFSFAHGWPGVLYAVMFANLTLGSTRAENLHPHITRRMDQLLGSYKLSIEASTKIQADQSDDSSLVQQILIPGWCNGAAGMIPFLLMSHRLYRRSELLDLASLAAYEAFSNPNRQAHLCCGVAGRVFGLLAMFRHTGENRWLDKARSLGLRLLNPKLPPGADKQTYSLFWGALGCALTLEELQYPEQACMPLFADAAWPAC